MRRTVDESENRRGLVLGLTLAELLLLLLFLFILALAWRVSIMRETFNDFEVKLREQVALANDLTAKLQSERSLRRTLEPLLAALRQRGRLDEPQVKQLLDRAARVEELESVLAELRLLNAELSAENARFKNTAGDTTKIASIDKALAAAQQIDPNDPPAVLVRAVELLKKAGPNLKAEDLPDGSILQELTQAKDSLALADGEREKLRRQLANLMKSGNGLTFPSCWMTSDGQTEYMFDIRIRDDGLIVKDATPGRSDDAQWQLVDSFDRGKLINETAFSRATSKLFAWSREEQCRFYVIIRDDTGPTSKRRYKQLRTLVEGHFYPLLLPVTASRGRGERPDSGIGGPFVPVENPGFPKPIGSAR